MWSSFTNDEKKLFLFLLVILCLGSILLPYVNERRKAEVFAAVSETPSKGGQNSALSSRSKPRENRARARVSSENELRLLDINAATAEELSALPSIGPARAAAIVEYRETHGVFRSTKDLMKVQGIGKGTFARIQDLITVAGVENTSASQPSQPKVIGFPAPSVTPRLVPPTAAPSGTDNFAAELIDVNSATVDQLAGLAQIGPILAERIVQYRQSHGPFRSLDELDKIPGIGKKRIELNRHRLIVH